MKKLLVISLGVLSLAACTRETVYYVEATTTTSPRTETTVSRTTMPQRTTTAAPYRGFSFTEEMYISSVYDLYTSYIYLSDDELLDLGWTICNVLDTGVSIETLSYYFATEFLTQLYDPSDGAEFLAALTAAAVFNLCPQHKWQLT
jgi:hypothetical protein